MGQMRVRRTGPWVKISCPFSWVQFNGERKASDRTGEDIAHCFCRFTLGRGRYMSVGESELHTRLSAKNRTQRLTRRNRGCFGWGWYHYPRYELHVHEHPRAGYQDGKLCRFGVLAGGALEERRKPAGQRCAYACRCPTGVAAPLGCVIFFCFCRNCGFMPCA